MKITGKIHVKNEAVQVSDKFRKREFVVEYADNPMYPQYIQFQLVQDNCEVLDPFEVGATVDVEFDIRGREWTSPQGEVKYFNTLQAWRITQVSAPETAAEPAREAMVKDSSTCTVVDDLPF